MKVLVVGSGGREHAIGRALVTAANVELFTAPGNPGTAAIGENLPVPAEDIAGIVAAARSIPVDLVVPGPEAPLVAGLADALAEAGIPCAGPGASAARLEGSKAFTRALTEAAGVPSPAFRVVERVADLDRALGAFTSPPVVKADGLAGGKGVFLPETIEGCRDAAESLLTGRLGGAGSRVVLEERLFGVEASWFHACRGTEVVPLPHAMDYKRLYEGEEGPNTGGMGAVSPNPMVGGDLEGTIRQQIVLPTLRRLQREGTTFRGFLFSGLMVTAAGPMLLEYNVRLGDPETQAVLPRLLDGAFLEVCAWVSGMTDAKPRIAFDERAACAVVLATEGYPDAPRTGDAIQIADGLETESRWLIHGGTRREGDDLYTAGGRVGAVVARGAALDEARRSAYDGVRLVQWPGMTHRTDIGLIRDA
jgi:phosphoribosylamine--glycine ligase